MYILYLDDSGSAQNPQEKNLVLGGISVYERHTYWFTQKLDELATKIGEQDHRDPKNIEFHAYEIFAGRIAPWNRFNKLERIRIVKDVLHIIRQSYVQNRIFACVVNKASYSDRDPMEIAFEDLCSRFNIHLNILYRESTESKYQHKGIIVLDNSAHETSLQKMAIDFRELGTRWGAIRDLAEVPLFADSRASRLIQVADHIAYAIFRRYEAGDTSYLDIIMPKFHAVGGVLHGLSHKTIDRTCMCPACMSR
jgi:hypothetical protein